MEGGALGLGGFEDFGFTDETGLTSAAVDVELALKIAKLAVGMLEIFERRTAGGDGCGESLLNVFNQSFVLG